VLRKGSWEWFCIAQILWPDEGGDAHVFAKLTCGSARVRTHDKNYSWRTEVTNVLCKGVGLPLGRIGLHFLRTGSTSGDPPGKTSQNLLASTTNLSC